MMWAGIGRLAGGGAADAGGRAVGAQSTRRLSGHRWLGRGEPRRPESCAATGRVGVAGRRAGRREPGFDASGVGQL